MCQIYSLLLAKPPSCFIWGTRLIERDILERKVIGVLREKKVWLAHSVALTLKEFTIRHEVINS